MTRNTWKSLCILTMAALLLLIGYKLDPRGSDVPSSLHPVTGRKWMQVGRTVDGKPMDDSDGVYMVVTEDGMMQFHVPDEETAFSGTTIVGEHFCRFSWLDPVAEFEISNHEDWSRMTRGIARLDKNKLMLCYLF